MITSLGNGVSLGCVASCMAAAAMAGCGGGDSGGASNSAKTDDALAKSDARNVVTFVESCFVDSQTYVGCGDPAKLNEPSVKVVASGSKPGEGEVSVVKTTRNGYTVTSKSKSGTEFTIVKAGNGPVRRTCTKADSGGCGPGGTW